VLQLRVRRGARAAGGTVSRDADAVAAMERVRREPELVAGGAIPPVLLPSGGPLCVRCGGRCGVAGRVAVVNGEVRHYCGRSCEELFGRGLGASLQRRPAAMFPDPRSAHPRRMLLVDRLGFERIEAYSGGIAHVVAYYSGTDCPGSRLGHATFERYGYAVRDGEELLEFREVERREIPMMPPAPELPTVAQLARALFETDPDVVAFVNRVSDCEIAAMRRGLAVAMPPGAAALVDPRRRQRAMQIAWDRDEHGWSERAQARAASALVLMGAK
jgi:hypothetical protein